jgi:Dit-like tail protein
MVWTDTSGTTNTITFDVVIEESWEENATVTEHPVEQGPDVSDHIRVSLPTCRLRVFATNEPIDQAIDGTLASSGQVQVPIPSVIVASNALSPNANTSGIVAYPNWVNPITLRALLVSAAGAGAGAVAGATGNAQSEGAALAEIAAVIGVELLAANLLAPATSETVLQQTDAGPSGQFAPILNPSPAVAQVQTWPNAQDYVYQIHQLLVSLKNAGMAFIVTGTKEGPVPNMFIEHLSFHRDASTGTGEEITIGLKQILIVTTQTVTITPISNLSGGGGLPSTNLGAQQAVPVQVSIAAKLTSTPGTDTSAGSSSFTRLP